MSTDAITIRETTQATVSGHTVSVSDIFTRNLPDAQGVVEGRVSAKLYIRTLDGREARREVVIVGKELMLGADRYCVVQINEGKTTPGDILIRQVVP